MFSEDRTVAERSVIRDVTFLNTEWPTWCHLLMQKPLSLQSNTTHEITQQISHKLPRMDVLTFETCWALNNEIIKQVTSSWPIFIQVCTCFWFQSKLNYFLTAVLCLSHIHNTSFSVIPPHWKKQTLEQFFPGWNIFWFIWFSGFLVLLYKNLIHSVARKKTVYTHRQTLQICPDEQQSKFN